MNFTEIFWVDKLHIHWVIDSRKFYKVNLNYSLLHWEQLQYIMERNCSFIELWLFSLLCFIPLWSQSILVEIKAYQKSLIFYQKTIKIFFSTQFICFFLPNFFLFLDCRGILIELQVEKFNLDIFILLLAQVWDIFVLAKEVCFYFTLTTNSWLWSNISFLW